MVDFKKLMEENEVFAEELKQHLMNLEEFENWLKAHGNDRVYSAVERAAGGRVVICDKERGSGPEISIWLPKWW